MSPDEFLLSALITWAVILIPPGIVRALVVRPLIKGAAIAWVVTLFFGNHIFFAWLTEEASGRPFLFLGAIAAYYVLTWQSRKQAELANAELRRFLGYDQIGGITPDSGAPAEDSSGRAITPMVTDLSAGSTSSNINKASEANKASSSPLNWSKGFFRLWVVASVLWVATLGAETVLSFASKQDGWFVSTHQAGRFYSPENATSFLRSQIDALRAQELGNSSTERGPKPGSLYYEIVDQRLTEIHLAAQASGIAQPLEISQISAATGLSPEQIARNPDRAAQLASGLELVAKVGIGAVAWPKGFDTRELILVVEWEIFLATLIGVPLLILAFGMTLRWVATASSLNLKGQASTQW